MERIVEPDEVILTVEHRRLTEAEEKAFQKAIARSKKKQQVRSSEERKDTDDQSA